MTAPPSIWSAKSPQSGDRVLGHIVVLVRIEREGSHFVGHAEPFKVSSFGNTIDKALNATLEATAAYLETLDDEGTRDSVFAELGVDFVTDAPDVEQKFTARLGEFVTPQRVSVLAAA
jgi:predicted RNase H-like HicB family nuclease